jgi:hypothetical protein
VQDVCQHGRGDVAGRASRQTPGKPPIRPGAGRKSGVPRRLRAAFAGGGSGTHPAASGLPEIVQSADAGPALPTRRRSLLASVARTSRSVPKFVPNGYALQAGIASIPDTVRRAESSRGLPSMNRSRLSKRGKHSSIRRTRTRGWLPNPRGCCGAPAMRRHRLIRVQLARSRAFAIVVMRSDRSARYRLTRGNR